VSPEGIGIFEIGFVLQNIEDRRENTEHLTQGISLVFCDVAGWVSAVLSKLAIFAIMIHLGRAFGIGFVFSNSSLGPRYRHTGMTAEGRQLCFVLRCRGGTGYKILYTQ